MSFQLVKFKASGFRSEGSTRRHAFQRAVFVINAANTDVTLDIANPTGTFWTQVQADPIYGALATQALAKVQAIQAVQSDLNQILGSFLYALIKVASAPGAGQYTLATSNGLPTFTFNSGTAPIAYEVTLGWNLKDGLEAVVDDRG